METPIFGVANQTAISEYDGLERASFIFLDFCIPFTKS